MTAPEWRDCADPDELAAAVAAGVEVQRMRGGGWVPSALTHRDDFAWFLTHWTRYQLPASWSPEPPASGAERYLAGRMADPEYRAAYEAAMTPPDGCEAVWLPTDVVDHYVSAEPPSGRWDRQASFVVDACREAQARRGTTPTPPPTPPWPGAVLSGLTDEDGEPTWLALAGDVRGEQARQYRDDEWCGSYNETDEWSETAWVEVRAPRAAPVPETERVPWYRATGRRQPGGDLLGPIAQAYPNPNLPGGMYVEYELPEHGTITGNPTRHPDGTVEVLKDGGQ